MPADASAAHRSFFTLRFDARLRRALLRHRQVSGTSRRTCGWIAWSRSNVDESLAPEGKHVMTCFVQYVPYHLRQGNWDDKRELLGDRVVKKIAEYAPNVPDSVVARQVLTPLDLERTYGLTEGNIFHGDFDSGAAILHASGFRMVAVPHPDRGGSICVERARTPAAGSQAAPDITPRTRYCATGKKAA